MLPPLTLFVVYRLAEMESDMTEELSRSAKRVQDALASLGTAFEVVQLPSST